MLMENINYLLKNHRDIREIMKEYDNKDDNSIELVSSKVGLPTIKVVHENTELYIHSKYDPIKESLRILKQYEGNIVKSKNIIFYGLGMAYHIEMIMKEYPGHNYFLYEPNPAIFHSFLSSRVLSEIVGNIHYELLIPRNEGHRSQLIFDLVGKVNQDILLVTHPSYERIYKSDLQEFLLDFKKYMKNRKDGVFANAVFQKRWTFNSVKNLKYTLKTPNILAELGNNPLYKKPAILVSAGPSLNDEIENLRKIKENKLAYIFSVGSANQALLKHGIEPDAVCTYDPSELNYMVFSEMVNLEKDHIPMIYGTSVGYETLEYYRGPKLHMITSQDCITPYFLGEDSNDSNTIVNDAPSVAVVTLQMLNQLGASPIILVGQNLAFRDDTFYAKGTEYEKRTEELLDKEKNNFINTIDVYGEEILTNDTFIQMKEAIEYYLQLWRREDIINTTVGGANIKGSSFLHLKDVMDTYLNEPIVEEEWYKSYKKSHKADLYSRLTKLKRQHELHFKTLNELQIIISDIEKHSLSNEKKLENLFYKLDKTVKKLERNQYYELFIKSIMKLEREQIRKASLEIKYMLDIRQKTNEIIKCFGNFIEKVIVNTKYMESVYLELEEL